MSEVVLKADLREGTGKGPARALRREGKIPGIIYGIKDNQQKVAVDGKDFTKEYNKGHIQSRPLTLEIDGKKERVIPREVQLNPVTDIIEHADFLRIDKGSKVNVLVPVKFLNAEKCTGLRRGGVLNVVKRDIEFICDIDKIPSQVEASLAGLNIGDTIHLSHLNIDESMNPTITDRDFTIATIVGRLVKDEAEETESESEEDDEEETE